MQDEQTEALRKTTIAQIDIANRANVPLHVQLEEHESRKTIAANIVYDARSIFKAEFDRSKPKNKVDISCALFEYLGYDDETAKEYSFFFYSIRYDELFAAIRKKLDIVCTSSSSSTTTTVGHLERILLNLLIDYLNETYTKAMCEID
jgi:hypothetical protein